MEIDCSGRSIERAAGRDGGVAEETNPTPRNMKRNMVRPQAFSLSLSLESSLLLLFAGPPVQASIRLQTKHSDHRWGFRPDLVAPAFALIETKHEIARRQEDLDSAGLSGQG